MEVQTKGLWELSVFLMCDVTTDLYMASTAFHFKHSYRLGYTAGLFLFDDLIDSVKLQADCEHLVFLSDKWQMALW